MPAYRMVLLVLWTKVRWKTNSSLVLFTSSHPESLTSPKEREIPSPPGYRLFLITGLHDSVTFSARKVRRFFSGCNLRIRTAI